MNSPTPAQLRESRRRARAAQRRESAERLQSDPELIAWAAGLYIDGPTGYRYTREELEEFAAEAPEPCGTCGVRHDAWAIGCYDDDLLHALPAQARAAHALGIDLGALIGPAWEESCPRCGEPEESPTGLRCQACAALPDCSR